MSTRSTRRRFLQQSALSASSLWVARRYTWADGGSANEKLGIAVIGVAGQGKYSLDHITDEAVVVLCDVDENRAAEARKRFPKAKFYVDFRRMLDAQDKDIDAVVVATPDHTHAPATIAALKAGKHVYCEKPLTHTVWEARQVALTAAGMKRVTQMGTQNHAHANYRRVVELIQTNTIGPVGEVHLWDNSVWSGGDRPADSPPVPEGLHYDLWLGPAPYRPYHPAYLPVRWRGWWDFGGGGHADMACHYMDLPYWALSLRHADTIEAKGPPVHPESAPPQLTVTYEYPPRGAMPAVTLTWSVGTNKPLHYTGGGVPDWRRGVLFVGTKGMLIADYKRHQLLPEKEFADFQPPDPFIPDSIGHHREWIEACKTGGTTTCNFDYASALTEAVLLGNVAYRSARKIEWDAKNLKITNAPEAMQYLRRP